MITQCYSRDPNTGEMVLTAVGHMDEGGVRFVPDPVASAALPANLPPEGRRRLAYEQEADVYRDQAISYEVEAEAWALEGNEPMAQAARAKADASRREYLARKQEIRRAFPDADEVYYLGASGTYHRTGCSYITASAETVTLSEITPGAKACSRCNPPAVEGGVINE